MQVNRRDFLKLVGGLGAASLVSLTQVEQALAGNADPRVVWLQGQSCSGCSVSLLNSIHYTTIDDLLVNTINLEYHPTLIASAGELALESATLHPSKGELREFSAQWLQNGEFDLNQDGRVNFVDYALLARQGFILVVEGAIPFGGAGTFCYVGGEMTMVEAFERFASDATHILAIGCGAFGGIPAATPNPTNSMGVTDALGELQISKPVVNIPGCPAHPDWIVGTIAYMLTEGTVPPLDTHNRPAQYYGDISNQRIHVSCPLKGQQNMAQQLGEYGCLEELGCKGKIVYADCPSRKWNSPAEGANGVNWCVQCGSPCHGCVEPDFPDGMSPFYNLPDVVG
jgi:hydrogenase small subunit